MKTIIIIKIFLITLILAACSDNKVETNKTVSEYSIFRNDSGYINKEIGLYYLQKKSLTDTLGSWDYIKENDTIGKYYRIQETRNYYVCLMDVGGRFTTHLILLTDSCGNILQKERFFHSHYPYCWDNYYDGFRKHENFFEIRTCATGCCFSCSELYLFKELLPQEKQTPIVLGYWLLDITDTIGKWEKLNSTVKELSKNKLTVNYYLTKGLEISTDASIIHKQTDSVHFDVIYLYDNNSWTAKDSNLLKQILQWR